MDVDSLTIAVAGVASVGLLTSTQIITGWVRELFALDGNQVRIAATCVAAYLVLMFGLTQTKWIVYDVDVAATAAWLGVGLYLVAVIASAASAYHEKFKVQHADVE
jgi:hypothetical protein